MVRRQTEKNFPLLLKNWETLLGKKDQIKDYIPGHWNGDLTYQGFKNRYNYIKTLWKGVTAAAKEGKSLTEIRTHFALEKKFPELVGSPGLDENWLHEESILSFYIDATGAMSAADALNTWIEKKGLDEALAKIKKVKAGDSDKYFFIEAEFNRLGYRLLSAKKIEEAIAVFKLNTEMYPKSWNTYDSLAEAHMVNGDKALAVKLYKKSLALNPKNENGKKMLMRLNSGTQPE
jgi:tetratricopeptide (TPR) repeat protein